jgi:hypothetical protein
MVKAAIVFLVVMLAIGMIGNALSPGLVGRTVRKRFGRAKPASCPRCGRYVIGHKGCECKKG